MAAAAVRPLQTDRECDDQQCDEQLVPCRGTDHCAERQPPARLFAQHRRGAGTGPRRPGPPGPARSSPPRARDTGGRAAPVPPRCQTLGEPPPPLPRHGGRQHHRGQRGQRRENPVDHTWSASADSALDQPRGCAAAHRRTPAAGAASGSTARLGDGRSASSSRSGPWRARPWPRPGAPGDGGHPHPRHVVPTWGVPPRHRLGRQENPAGSRQSRGDRPRLPSVPAP